MEISEDSNRLRKALIILVFQIIAWSMVFTPFFEDYSSGNDAAGAGMARGFAIFFVTVPSMAFVFSVLYILFLKKICQYGLGSFPH